MRVIKKRKSRARLDVGWRINQIEAGVYVIKNNSPKGSTNLDFARKMVFKICYKYLLNTQCYGLCNCLTDGWYHDIGSKEDVMRYLNRNNFRPLTKREYLKLIKDTNHGFVQKFLVII